MASPKTVNDLMTMMTANFVNYKLMPETVIFYSKILVDIPDDILEAATLDICSRPGAFFPSVGDWRQKALDIKLNKAGIPSEYEAWEELISMGDGEPIKKVREKDGKYYIDETPRFWKNAIAEKISKVLGWPEFPDPENLSYDRHVFMEAYKDQCRRIDTDARTLPDVKQITQGYTESTMKQLSEGMEK
jgi:hypothetical protein